MLSSGRYEGHFALPILLRGMKPAYRSSRQCEDHATLLTNYLTYLEWSGTSMTVNLLVCDDSEDIAEVVSIAAGVIWPECQVQIANNGIDSLRLFNDFSPDLVVLDITMPEIDGFEVC